MAVEAVEASRPTVYPNPAHARAFIQVQPGAMVPPSGAWGTRSNHDGRTTASQHSTYEIGPKASTSCTPGQSEKS